MVPQRSSLPGMNDWDAQVDLQFSFTGYHKWRWFLFFTISKVTRDTKINSLIDFFKAKGWWVRGLILKFL